MQGGGGSLEGYPYREPSAWTALSGIVSGALRTKLSSRTRFGICQAPPVEFNVGQMLKQVQHDRKRYNPARSAHKEPLTHASSLLTKTAFTMAEILLSLTIIGVVAAITLPSLTGNINERTWNTQRKALYARMSQAVALMPALNGYGVVKGASSEGASDAVDTATETFIADGLSKVMKINNICDSNHLSDCGIVSSFTTIKAASMSMPNTLYLLDSNFSSTAFSNSSYSTMDTKAAAFETQNGESIVAFYNQACRASTLDVERTSSGGIFGFPEATMCVNLIYDLNGSKGPNTIGKDMGFMTIFNATDPIVVAPMPSATVNANNNASTDYYGASKACTAQNPDSRLPNIEELAAMVINHGLIDIEPNKGYWSSSLYSSENSVWTFYYDSPAGSSYWYAGSKTFGRSVRCIKR